MKKIRWFYLLCIFLTTAWSLAQEPANRKIVEILYAEYMRSLPYEGHTITRLIGDVQLMHNEALMTCDSAYLYPSNRFEAFGHIMIIKESTTLYGDTLYYDGNNNLARIRGKLIRLEDSSAILRTFNLDFNTKDNVAYFFGGGNLADKENILESEKGYYYSNLKLAKFQGAVEMHNETYDILSDSLHYYTQTETAVFLGHTSIWHNEGYLSCERGWYERPKNYFHFAQDAYVQSEAQEMWADSIFYARTIEKSDLFGNIQILDTTKSVLLFGDEAHISNNPQQALITRNPSAAYYSQDEQEKRDTIFLRADTLQFITLNNPELYKTDSLPATDSLLQDSTKVAKQLSPLHETIDISKYDTLFFATAFDINVYEGDTLCIDEYILLPDIELVEPSYYVHMHDSSLLNSREAIDISKYDTLFFATAFDINVYEGDTLCIDEYILLPDIELIEPSYYGHMHDSSLLNSTVLHLLPSKGLWYLDTLQTDLHCLRTTIPSTSPPPAHSNIYHLFANDSIQFDEIFLTDTLPPVDSTLQYLYAYRSVRIYRSNAQAACDSMVFFVNDTLTEMFYNPVLWSENRQITSDKMRFISKDSVLHMGEFLGSAFMISETDTTYYDQVRSRDMFAYFENNELYLMDIVAGVQTIFFMEEDSVIANINFAESANMKIYVENRKITRVKYINKPKIDLHPIDEISRDKQRLRGFEWRNTIRPKTRYDVCDRIIKPSKRAETVVIVKPDFPITKKINTIDPNRLSRYGHKIL